MKKKTPTTTDALKIMDQEFFAGKPQRLAELEQPRADDAKERQNAARLEVLDELAAEAQRLNMGY